jgi:hypothetical protein
MPQKFFGGFDLETQYKHRAGYVRLGYELRVLGGIYGARLVYRGELGALMGGDRSHSDIQALWESLPIYGGN